MRIEIKGHKGRQTQDRVFIKSRSATNRRHIGESLFAYHFCFQNNDMDYMGDSPVGISLNPNDDSLSDGCSPLPDVLITDACAAQQCKFHGDCGNENERCCSNGCVKTCLKQREPPPCMHPVCYKHSLLVFDKFVLIYNYKFCRRRHSMTVVNHCNKTFIQLKLFSICPPFERKVRKICV